MKATKLIVNHVYRMLSINQFTVVIGIAKVVPWTFFATLLTSGHCGEASPAV